MSITIPKCYRLPLKRWLNEEFGLTTERSVRCWADAMHLHIVPVFTQEHVVFALCNLSDNRMIYALKMARNREKDARFITQILCAFST